MVRAKRMKPLPKLKKTTQYDENDPEAYKNMPVPDKKSSQYTKDNIDEFHDEKIAKLLAHGVQMESDQEEIDDEEEVMALDDSESSEEDDDDDDDEEEEEGTDMESDLEGKNMDELPNEMAWGTRKKMFYDSDYGLAKGKSQEDLETEEQEEEEEAIKIQKRLAANLSEEDYDLNLFEEFAVEDESKTTEEKDHIVKDLKQMSRKEKMKLLRKESPELLDLIQDFKAKLTELKDEVQPLVQMVKDGKIPAGKGADYLRTKQQLYLNYCTNISFYLVLKAKRIPVHNHPVIERLLTYRNLINELGAVDARLASQYRLLLAGEETTSKPVKGKKTKVSRENNEDDKEVTAEVENDSDSDLDEEAALRYYRKVEERIKLKRKSNDTGNEEFEEKEDEEELDPDGKRGITYQMAKNKGLTPKRKKIDRNPRVKHRHKFKRAVIRRKGQVREVRREETRYSGELSGIRAGVKKSVKLK
ncbi:something about silencing protein 10 [Gouania willdenowi]|uniref:Sas10 C-terminal domain-containing protein n=1 Tax=Gouania willdenowi TaxID=441366 RepID=A0A8C5HIU2_GOUWI|nr:something about silencing protein 10 [Gouania willdenowi]